MMVTVKSYWGHWILRQWCGEDGCGDESIGNGVGGDGIGGVSSDEGEKLDALVMMIDWKPKKNQILQTHTSLNFPINQWPL